MSAAASEAPGTRVAVCIVERQRPSLVSAGGTGLLAVCIVERHRPSLIRAGGPGFCLLPQLVLSVMAVGALERHVKPVVLSWVLLHCNVSD